MSLISIFNHNDIKNIITSNLLFPDVYNLRIVNKLFKNIKLCHRVIDHILFRNKMKNDTLNKCIDFTVHNYVTTLDLMQFTISDEQIIIFKYLTQLIKLCINMSNVKNNDALC